MPLAALVLCVSSFALRAQSPQLLALSKPEAVLRHEFTFIVDVHELPDGQLAVLDQGDVGVLLADAALGATRPVGRLGGGPGEYRVPVRLFGMPSAHFAVLDRTQFHLLRYDSDGNYVDALKPDEISRCGNDVQSPVGNRFSATDATGRVYLQGSAIARNGDGQYEVADSAPILRWTPPCAVDTVGFTPVPHSNVGRVETRPGRQPFVAGVVPEVSPFASEAQWAVQPDGSIVIVHLAPYRVEIINGSGARARGAVIANATIPLTDGHRAQWRGAKRAARPILTMR